MSITKTNLLEHELKTNDGFKVIITGNGQALESIVDTEYFNKDSKFLYLEKNVERYTRHTRVVTDSKGHSHTETYYSWDHYDSDIKQIKDIKILNHEFKNVPLGFDNIKSVHLDKIINKKYEDKIAGNYIYPNGKYLHMVGDKRLSFNGVYDNSLISLAGEISNKTIIPYRKYNKVRVFNNGKEDILKQLKSQHSFHIIIYLIGVIVLTGGGTYYYNNTFKKRKFRYRRGRF